MKNNQFCSGASAVGATDICQNLGTTQLKRVISVLLVVLVVTTVSLAEETAFNGVKVADAKGKQADARLIFSDSNQNVVIRVADRDFVTIPYAQLDKFSYEYTKKHRVTQGALVMVASLGAGAIVMLTKSKSHWLYIDFHEQDVPKSAVLRMDKKEYKKICEAVKTHTGKEVEFLGETKGKSNKKGNKEIGKSS
ncbi:MAG: hypothetical protein LAO04_18925 [Acidobacteriia bacterium]|nr:hypothetical protein [Terriglobia bacterium]